MRSVTIYAAQLERPITLRRKSDSRLMRLQGWLLKPFTPQFMERFWTTVGHTVYTPTRYDDDADWGSPEWQERHRSTILHEIVHVAQLERWGAVAMLALYAGPAVFTGPAAALSLLGPRLAEWSLWPSAVLGAATVLLLPLSFGLAWGRWRVEREAYMIQVLARQGAARTRTIQWVADTLWGSYLWTWPPSWTVAWFERKVRGA